MTNPQAVGAYVSVTARAMNRAADDSLHLMVHSLEGGNEGCATCIAVRERIAAYRAEHPDDECDCDCCDHRA